MVAGLAAGYDPNREEELHPKFGTTPVIEAAFHGRDEIVKELIEHNAQLDTQSEFGWTAPHYAGQAKQAGCVALLVAAGASRAIKRGRPPATVPSSRTSTRSPRYSREAQRQRARFQLPTTSVTSIKICTSKIY